jgi:holo-[acyl-carrier protein] synthase
MIVGVGVDAVEIDRVARALERHPGFGERVYTRGELQNAERRGAGRVAYLAKRWAAKEAVSKALGVGFSGLSYTDIEVTNLRSGAPTVTLHGEVAEWGHQLGVLHWHLSLSDTRDTAVAMVVAEGPDDYPRHPTTPPPWVARRLERQRERERARASQQPPEASPAGRTEGQGP